MNQTGYTPGPWHTTIAQPGNMLEAVNQDGEYVCSLLGGDEHKQENARLIAAAPELLEAGKAIIAAWERGDLAATVRRLSVVIEKAEL